MLDDTRSPTIEGLTDEFTNLKTLSLNHVGLTRLKGFPRLPQLKRLELSDNRINGGLDLLKRSPNLTHLNLSGNKISELEALEPLREFVHLKSLDLFNNPVLNAPGYREKVFKLIPSLKYLDGLDADNQEPEETDDSGEDDDLDGDYDEEDEDNFIEEDDVGTARLVRADDEEDEDDEDDEDFEANEEDDDASLDEECEDEEDDEQDGEAAAAAAPRAAQGDHANSSDQESG